MRGLFYIIHMWLETDRLKQNSTVTDKKIVYDKFCLSLTEIVCGTTQV
jgi:hypothetical protein